MSYSRFSEGDVYVFRSSQGIECCACRLSDAPFGTFIADSNQAMLEHLAAHRAAGQRVPERALERLADPADEARSRAIWSEPHRQTEVGS